MTVDELERVVSISTGRWRRRLRAWRRWLLLAAVLAVLAFGAWVVFLSSWLGVRTVQVQGAPEVLSGQVSAAAGLSPGTPLARVDLGAVRARVEAIPLVASASVSRHWPHTVVISVTERRPVAVTRHDGAWWVLDKDGVLFAKAAAGDAGEPIVELDGSPGPQTLPSVASVLAQLPAGLQAQTRRVTAASMDSITLVLKTAVRSGGGAPPTRRRRLGCSRRCCTVTPRCTTSPSRRSPQPAAEPLRETLGKSPDCRCRTVVEHASRWVVRLDQLGSGLQGMTSASCAKLRSQGRAPRTPCVERCGFWTTSGG